MVRHTDLNQLNDQGFRSTWSKWEFAAGPPTLLDIYPLVEFNEYHFGELVSDERSGD